jgi:hypothetical protein
VRTLTKALWTFVAAVFLVEAWLWDTLGPVVGRLVALLPLAGIRDSIRGGISRLSPYATLPVFVLPALVLTPFKLAAMWLLANGHPVLGVAAFLVAKSVGLGVTAFLFDACRPNLMRMPWFVRLYDLVMRANAWAHLQADPYLRGARKAVADARSWIAQRMPEGRMGRRVKALRGRSHRAARRA